MKYISTRGQVAPVNFTQAIMMGLATDGGLLLPEQIPHIDTTTLHSWKNLNFQELAANIITPYIDTEISSLELKTLIQSSYTKFTHPEITPLIQTGDLKILELFHGPTAAFKDIALQFLGNLFELLLKRSGQHLNILGATSGDTGSAAIYGVRGKENINIFILHPLGRVSPMQERQMTTVLDPNVYNIAIRGTFDDAQKIVKTIFNDLEFKQRYHLGAINSINWARVLAQIVYYFYAWIKFSNGNPDKFVNFAVPTGNFGDIFAGYIAKRMGLPISKLILATNQNDILTRFVHSGVYQIETVRPSISPSMDIQVASNFERYLYYLVGEEPKQVHNLLQELDNTQRLQITKAQHVQVNQEFAAVAVTEKATLEQMKATYEQTGYILDPHTAVGVKAAQAYSDTICLATAHPAKFNTAVQQALGRAASIPQNLQGLLKKETRCVTLDADIGVIKNYLYSKLEP